MMGQAAPCDCCGGQAAHTPLRIDNRPGLSALAVRVGTHPRFKASMLAALSAADRPALADLQTREDDDLTIALLDGWASVADVLSFYNERIANESYLRTATERRSVLELARAIGYELRPGVAAETALAFIVEGAEGTPGYALLDAGLKVQSVPNPGEHPQTYETAEPLLGYAAWNELRGRTRAPRLPAPGDDSLLLRRADNASTGLRVGDALLLVGAEWTADLATDRWQLRRVREVISERPEEGEPYDRVLLDSALDALTPASNPKVYALRRRVSAFGYNAPDFRSIPAATRKDYGGESLREWPGLTLGEISSVLPSSGIGTGLFGEYFDDRELSVRRTSRVDATLDFTFVGGASPISGVSGDTYSMRWTGWLRPLQGGLHKLYVESDDGVRMWIDDALVTDDWTDHSARVGEAEVYLTRGRPVRLRIEYYNNLGEGRLSLRWSYLGQTQQVVPSSQLFPATDPLLHLDAIYPTILPGSWLVLTTPDASGLYQVEQNREDTRTRFALTAKTSRLSLRGARLHDLFNDDVRRLAIFAESEPLELVDGPLVSDYKERSVVVRGVLDSSVARGRKLILQSQKDGLIQQEVALVSSSEAVDGRYTRLLLVDRLTFAHPTQSLLVRGNVAMATHGETVQEILGSGDSSQRFQRFLLREAPLTYVRSSGETGSATTLQVWVNDVRWSETRSFLDAGPRDRVFVLEHADEGRSWVMFGDGLRGARLPSGRENVRAIYRKGSGIAGEVAAGQLKLPMTRPLGLKAVINPQSAAGSAEPQSLADARRNAPLSVLTLGRVVSLADYEDYARNYPGLSKAQAVWTWNVNSRGVFLTLAGENAAQSAESFELARENLLQSLRSVSDARVTVVAKLFRSAHWKLAGRVVVDSEYNRELVEVEIKTTLKRLFGFAARDFGVGVAVSELISAIQRVRGVRFVDLDAFYLGSQSRLERQLWAEQPRSGGAVSELLPAQLLTLDESALDALEMIPT